jgi:hypothetical protein
MSDQASICILPRINTQGEELVAAFLGALFSTVIDNLPPSTTSTKPVDLMGAWSFFTFAKRRALFETVVRLARERLEGSRVTLKKLRDVYQMQSASATFAGFGGTSATPDTFA